MVVRVRQASTKKEFETQEKKQMRLKEILPSFSDYHKQKCAERLQKSKSQQSVDAHEKPRAKSDKCVTSVEHVSTKRQPLD